MDRLALVSIILFTAAPLLAEEITIPFEIHEEHRALLVTAEAEGRPVVLIVDTGSSTTILTPRAAGMSNFEIQRSRFTDVGLKVRGRWRDVDLVLGSLSYRDHPVAVANLDAVSEIYGRPIDGILGQDILLDFESFRIDLRNRELTLRR